MHLCQGILTLFRSFLLSIFLLNISEFKFYSIINQYWLQMLRFCNREFCIFYRKYLLRNSTLVVLYFVFFLLALNFFFYCHYHSETNSDLTDRFFLVHSIFLPFPNLLYLKIHLHTLLMWYNCLGYFEINYLIQLLRQTFHYYSHF